MVGDLALAEAQAVRALVQDDDRREKLAALVAAVQEGEVAGDDAEALEELLELGLQSGRVRALYGPDGEQAALKVYRRLPVGKELGAAAKDVNEALKALEEIIELGLSTGRIRGVYGPEGEQAALKTYRKLPRGRELGDRARDVTDALAALEGKTLEQVRVQSAGPGAYLVTIGVDGLELTVRLDRSGPRVHSVGV